jgi:hypothetical protein
VAGKVALARLDYAEAVRQLKGVKGAEAAGLRGRALWYKGELDAAADELELLLDDPDVHDDWAKSISKLARRGTGRAPFTMSGALLAAVDMPHVSPTMPVFLVPLEIDGESALGMVATGTAEVVLDSETRSEPSWVSLRFGGKLEISDVPAMAQDLSGLSRQVGAPIKALLGVNLLRHMNVTLDYGGHQFVVRTFVPPKPPSATRVDLAYLRGGGMILGAGLGTSEGSRAPLLVDTSMSYPMALDAGGWKKLSIDPMTLSLMPDDPAQKLREGPIPMIRLGAFDVPRVPAMFGAPPRDRREGPRRRPRWHRRRGAPRTLPRDPRGRRSLPLARRTARCSPRSRRGGAQPRGPSPARAYPLRIRWKVASRSTPAASTP